MFDLAGILDCFPCLFTGTVINTVGIEFTRIGFHVRRGGYEGTSERSVFLKHIRDG